VRSCNSRICRLFVIIILAVVIIIADSGIWGENSVYAYNNMLDEETIRLVYRDKIKTLLDFLMEMEVSIESVEVDGNVFYMANPVQFPDGGKTIEKIMNSLSEIIEQRKNADRGDMQYYFDKLSDAGRDLILFCEAILLYENNDDENINKLFPIIEKVLYDFEINGGVVDIEGILRANGIDDEVVINRLKVAMERYFELNKMENLEVQTLQVKPEDVQALSVDKTSEDSEEIEKDLPYKPGYTSRENMLLAAASLVGKVRYVWGGGHLTTGNIKGINPVWQEFFNLYKDENGIDRGTCIQRNNGWCPIHGFDDSGYSCTVKSSIIRSVDDYRRYAKKYISKNILDSEYFRQLIKNSVDFSKEIHAHSLDGLDCSGFVSWLFNQIDMDTIYDSTAMGFVEATGLTEIDYRGELLPGDVFAWTKHIVVIVGKVEGSNNVYIVVEAAPNMVKFGVAYNGRVSKREIEMAKKIVFEVNQLIGNIPRTEEVKVYNMDRAGYYREEKTNEIKRYAKAGRLSKKFIDEGIVIPEYGKRIIDMSANEILQYLIDRLPTEYLSGLENYRGELFDIDKHLKIDEEAGNDELKVDMNMQSN
jgi:cell wall-associated NlpC family hydrolase